MLGTFLILILKYLNILRKMFIDSLLKPKSNEDIINNLIKLNQEEKYKKLIYN